MKIKLLTHQHEILKLTHKYNLLLGGVGAGKTYCGSAWVVLKTAESPDSLGLITANTYGQLQKATLASLFKQLTEWGISFAYNQQKSLLTINNQKKFLCLGLDSYDNHRGIEVGEWWGDEAAYNKREAFEVMSGRLRDKRGKLDVLLTTTPHGFNWVYDFFHESGEHHDSKHYRYISARSTVNKHLPKGYIESIRSQYDDKLIEQEIEGKFVSLTSGRAYYAFERDNVVKEVELRAGSILVGMDFNVDPMTATICQVFNNIIYVKDEIFLRNSDTFQMIHELEKRKYRGVIYPDSTSRSRKTSGRSDYDILRNEGFQIEYTHNPYVIDRVNNINRLLSKGRIIIDPKCKKLINDLEKVSWKDNKLDQKTDPQLTHISDALGYLAWSLYPIRDTNTKAKIRIY